MVSFSGVRLRDAKLVNPDVVNIAEIVPECEKEVVQILSYCKMFSVDQNGLRW
jgi:hypothetical protein